VCQFTSAFCLRQSESFEPQPRAGSFPSCSWCALKSWSCSFSARTLFRMAYLRLTGWAGHHPFPFLACPVSCSVLGSLACCFWLPCPTNTAEQRLQFAAVPGSVDRAWLRLSSLGCSGRRAGGAGVVQGHLSSGCLNLCQPCCPGGRNDGVLK